MLSTHLDVDVFSISNTVKARKAGHVYKEVHDLTPGPGCCLKLLPEGADTSIAAKRMELDFFTFFAVRRIIEGRPGPNVSLTCRICKGKTKIGRETVIITLPQIPEQIVWHLRME